MSWNFLIDKVCGSWTGFDFDMEGFRYTLKKTANCPFKAGIRMYCYQTNELVLNIGLHKFTNYR